MFLEQVIRDQNISQFKLTGPKLVAELLAFVHNEFSVPDEEDDGDIHPA